VPGTLLLSGGERKSERGGEWNLSHVALRREDDGLDVVLGVVDAHGLADLQHAARDLRVGKFGEAQDEAARLDRLCSGSISHAHATRWGNAQPMILSDWLQARAKRVVLLYSSMVRRNACWAPSVMLSASSRMTILCRPGGSVTFCWANSLILLRTTSIPLSNGPSKNHSAKTGEPTPVVGSIQLQHSLAER